MLSPGQHGVFDHLVRSPHRFGLRKMVGEFGGVVTGLVAIKGLQRFTDLDVEPHSSAIGKPFAQRLLDDGMAKVCLPLYWDFLDQMGS